MNRGLYIAMTSLVNNQKRMDVLSNNLSNINTTGYKKDYSVSESFPEKLLAKKTRTGELRSRNLDNISLENQGDQYFAKIRDGFFRIETPIGISHVKEMNFVVDGEGNLRTSYKNYRGDRTSLRENYVLDPSGNRVRGVGNIDEDLIRGLIYSPKNYIVGTMSGGVRYKRSFTDFSQGGIIDTGASLDVAILGDGFFKIQAEDGVKYTRNGSFSLDRENRLVDLDNRPVLSTGGQPITVEDGDVNISENGTVKVDGRTIARIDIAVIENTEVLKKIGDNLYEVGLDEDGEELQLIEAGEFEGKLLQNHLEASNMNAVDGMVDMITILREFEMNQKVVKMQDEMLEKAATEIARV